jgi:hypothetical protein
MVVVLMKTRKTRARRRKRRHDTAVVAKKKAEELAEDIVDEVRSPFHSRFLHREGGDGSPLKEGS